MFPFERTMSLRAQRRMDATVHDTDSLLHDSSLSSRAAALRLDLRALLAGCAAAGMSAERVCEHAGIPALDARVIDAGEAQAAIVRFWETVLTEHPDPLTPLWIGAAVPFGLYPLLDHLNATSETCEVALQRLTRYYQLVSPKLSVQVGNEELVLEPTHGPMAARRVISMYATGIILSRLQRLLVERLAPRTIELTAAGGGSEPARVVKWLGTRATYGGTMTRIVFRPETWRRRLAGAQPALGFLLAHYADERVVQRSRAEDPLAEIRAAIRIEQENGEARIARVARRLGMTERTLQRRLAENDVTFRQLLGEQLSERAKQLLAQRNLAIGEVAYALGYSEQTAFSRAFRRWTGLTPNDYRRGV